MPAFSLHPESHLTSVHIIVSDLKRALDFYGDALGFKLLKQTQGTATLGTDDTVPFLVLTEQSNARSKPPRATGLYHFAILLPGRIELARSFRRLLELRYPLQGAADHLVSEAIYLADPDGNGIELYRDRPRAEWPRHNGQLQMATDPLDADGLLGELQSDNHSWEGLPSQTRLGHIHLHVADISQAEAFYRDILGFDLILRYGPSAIFLSVGGYHHHIGANTWAGVGAPPPPRDAVGLRDFTISLPNKAELTRLIEHLKTSKVNFKQHENTISVHDPSTNRILFTFEN
jgi:catechol 2,3-dioxygenase